MIAMLVIILAVIAGGFLYYTAKSGGSLKVTTGNIVVDINYSKHDNSSSENISIKNAAEDVADKVKEEAQNLGEGLFPHINTE